MSINKGYLTAKTDKASDEYYTPREAVIPILKYIDKGNKKQYTGYSRPYCSLRNGKIRGFQQNPDNRHNQAVGHKN